MFQIRLLVVIVSPAADTVGSYFNEAACRLCIFTLQVYLPAFTHITTVIVYASYLDTAVNKSAIQVFCLHRKTS